jgi:hypothetical protein
MTKLFSWNDGHYFNLLLGFKMFSPAVRFPSFRCLFPTLSILIRNFVLRVLSKSTFILCHRATELSGRSLRLVFWMLFALIPARTSADLTWGLRGFLNSFLGANTRIVPQVMPQLHPSNRVTIPHCKPTVQKLTARHNPQYHRPILSVNCNTLWRVR